MSIFYGTFEAVATTIVIGILGFIITSRKVLAEESLKFLSTLSLDIALPCMIFVNIVTNLSIEKFKIFCQLPLWWLALTFFLFLLSYGCAFISKKEFKREFKISLFYQNALFLPIILISQIYGAESIILTALFFFGIFFPSFFFSTYHFFYRNEQIKIELKKVFNPVLISTFAAIIISITGLQQFIPMFFISSLEMVGKMSVPLLFLVLGGSIYLDYKQRGEIQIIEVIKFVTLKNIIFPATGLGLLILVKPPSLISLLIFMQFIVPPVTAIPVIVNNCNGNRNIANQFLLASFIFSIISMPLMMILFSKFFTIPI